MDVKSTLKAVRVLVKKAGGRKKIKISRIIPLPKTGEFLPLIPLFAGLSALGALAGGVYGIVRAVNDSKAARQKLEEVERHNKSMEAIALGKQGSGLFLKRYKSGLGLYLRKEKKKLPINLPRRPLSNIDLDKYANKLNIYYFRGIFVRWYASRWTTV